MSCSKHTEDVRVDDAVGRRGADGRVAVDGKLERLGAQVELHLGVLQHDRRVEHLALHVARDAECGRVELAVLREGDLPLVQVEQAADRVAVRE